MCVDRSEAMRIVQARFAGSDPELANGFAEHAPMGAEAMLSLGLDPEAVVRWAERHDPEPADASSPIRVAEDGLRDELDEGEWRPAATRFVDALIGGLDAHLFHGLIRTAHAVRALGHDDSATGRAELATGLAAWRVWIDEHGTPDPEWVGDDPIEFVIDAAHRGAAAFLDEPSILTIHALTAPMAFLLLADLVDAAAHRRAASVFARTHRRYPAPPANPTLLPRPDAAELSGLLRRWDAHPAKFVEAALRGHDTTGHATFLLAARAMLR